MAGLARREHVQLHVYAALLLCLYCGTTVVFYIDGDFFYKVDGGT